MIERYLYDVVRRLPEKQRKDIEEELRTLIEDMLEEREGNKSREENIKDVLSELGDPAKLAMKYRGEEAHLIGGEYYSLYCQILKLVLICVGISVTVSALVHLVVRLPLQEGAAGSVADSIAGGFLSLAGLPGVLLEAFGFVTLVFWVMERNQVKLRRREPWSLEKLTQIPGKKAMISKSDSIIGILVSIFVLVIFICLPECIGVWVKNADGELVTISIFNLSVWSKALSFFAISMAAGIVDDLVKLIIGYYNRTVMYVSIACSLISLAAMIILFKGFAVFNVNFMDELSAVTGKTFSAKHDILLYWKTRIAGVALPDFFLVLIGAMILIDLAVAVYRTLRYGQRGNER